LTNAFEASLVKAFNAYFEESGTKAYAFRNKQFRFCDQIFDIFVDSRDPALYLAIECKSVDAETTRKLYWKKHFAWADGVCQVERESKHLSLTGRYGLLAVEARRGKGQKSGCWLVPWETVSHSFRCGESGLWPEQITYSVSLTKTKGKYHIDNEIVDKIGQYLNIKKNFRGAKSWKNNLKQ
jgi:hypothetical protein